MMPLVTVHGPFLAADQGASGVSSHRAMSVMPDIRLMLRRRHTEGLKDFLGLFDVSQPSPPPFRYPGQPYS